jgi:prophage ps3 protein 01
MYNAIVIANYIIEYEHSQNRSISNLKLQKLLYFVQAQFFRELGEPCFSDKIEAWSFGPVVVNVYHAYKFYGGMDITEVKENVYIDISNKDKRIINKVLESFAKVPIYRLVEITHHQTPWMSAIKNFFSNEITNESIQQYFCNA